jgi:phosphate:Na+ symporter
MTSSFRLLGVGLLFLMLLGASGCALPETSAVEPPPQRARLAGTEVDVQFLGGGRICQVGAVNPEPMEVTITDAQTGSSLARVGVEFLVFSQKASLLHDGDYRGRQLLVTNRDGQAAVNLKAPKKMGNVTTRVQVLDPETQEVVLERKLTSYAISPMLLLFQFMGGISIFLFGMKMMTDALQAAAGDRLRNILQALTRRRVTGLAAGAVITAGIQSSSATTVMVVGLVNAGLLTLNQAVPVMFGANIGTTITAQVIAFKITKYSYPMLFVGLLFQLLGMNRKQKYFGEVIFGLGLLFQGMSLMGAVFKPLAGSADVKAVFVAFSTHPVLGLLAGTLMTVLIQSSSATVGITLTLASAGFLDFRGAFALILGDNIGTTITAILASLSARTAARRAAFVHTLFNAVGACIMLGLLYVPWDGQPIYLQFIDRITPGDVFAAAPGNIERHIANSHAIFNIAFALLFLPLSNRFADLARALVPGEKSVGPISHLAPNLVETPSVALHSCKMEMAEMAVRLQGMFVRVFRGFDSGDPEDFDAVAQDEFEIDRSREDISNYLVQISEHELTAEDAERIPRLLHSVNDLERFGDLVNEVVKLGRRRHEKDLSLSEVALEEISQLKEVLAGMLQDTEQLLRTGDAKFAFKIRASEERVDLLEERFRKHHIKRMKEGSCQVISGIVFLDLLTILEKHGDFLHNIAVALGD